MASFDGPGTPTARDFIGELDEIVAELIQENQNLRATVERLETEGRNQLHEQHSRLEHVIAQYREYRKPTVVTRLSHGATTTLRFHGE